MAAGIQRMCSFSGSDATFKTGFCIVGKGPYNPALKSIYDCMQN